MDTGTQDRRIEALLALNQARNRRLQARSQLHTLGRGARGLSLSPRFSGTQLARTHEARAHASAHPSACLEPNVRGQFIRSAEAMHAYCFGFSFAGQGFFHSESWRLRVLLTSLWDDRICILHTHLQGVRSWALETDCLSLHGAGGDRAGQSAASSQKCTNCKNRLKGNSIAARHTSAEGSRREARA